MTGTKKTMEKASGHGGRSTQDYSGDPCTTEPPQNQSKICVRSKCVLIMVKVFIVLKDEFLQRDRTVPCYQLQNRDLKWFWCLSASFFNRADVEDINFNLFEHSETYPEEMR